MTSPTCPTWATDLSVSGLYYDGVLDKNKLQDVLELHKRDTVSTFGTRSSSGVSSEAKHKVITSSKVLAEAEKENHVSNTIESSTPKSSTLQVGL